MLDAVELVPAGQVATYGDIAEWTGRGSGRTVGTVLSRYGHEVAWWRVVQAGGRPAEPHLQDALGRLRAEGCPVVGERVDLAAARWRGADDLPVILFPSLSPGKRPPDAGHDHPAVAVRR